MTTLLTRPLPTLADLHDEANWLEWRARAFEHATMFRATELVTTEQGRAEFLEGARLLRLDRMQRAGDGGNGPSPIQLAIADMLGAGYFLNGILEPRRTTKTTSIQAVLLGRCTMREDYTVGWTLATTGQKTGERFRKDIVNPIQRLYPDPKARPMDVGLGNGHEHLAWPNGSTLNIYAPNGDGFRSGGFDVAWIDEGGEADAELGEDLIASVLPTMDTKPGAQFIVSGTGAKFRDGNLLWDVLEDPAAGIIRHGIPDSIEPEELDAWDPTDDHPRARVRELVIAAHPGVGYTTPLEAVQRNYEHFPREKFLAEYLGVFGDAGKSARLIPAAPWEAGALGGQMPPAPDRFTLALAVHPDGLWSSLGVAFHWQPDLDLVQEAQAAAGEEIERTTRTAIGLLHHQNGTQGIATKALMFARKYKVPIIYDSASQAAGVEIEQLQRANPRPQFKPATTVDVRRAATKTLKLLEQKNLVHWREQRPLENAAEIAIKRTIGGAGGFGFGRPRNDPNADITPLEACSLALHFLDDAPVVMKPGDVFDF